MDGVAPTRARPPGRASATDTVAAASGPLFSAVTVKVTLSPNAGVASSTVFVTATSACWTSTLAEAVLGVAGSYVPDVAVAVLVIGVVTVTAATIVRVSVAPPARSPIAHVPVALVYAPTVGVAETNVSPAGSASVTVAAVAVSGPVLVTPTLNVTFAPSVGVLMSTLLVITRSASGTSTVTVSVSLAATGSRVVDVTDAVLATAVCVVTCATIARVSVAPLARVPMFHTPVAAV